MTRAKVSVVSIALAACLAAPAAADPFRGRVELDATGTGVKVKVLDTGRWADDPNTVAGDFWSKGLGRQVDDGDDRVVPVDNADLRGPLGSIASMPAFDAAGGYPMGGGASPGVDGPIGVPEPDSLGLIFIGLGAAVLYSKRWRGRRLAAGPLQSS